MGRGRAVTIQERKTESENMFRAFQSIRQACTGILLSEEEDSAYTEEQKAAATAIQAQLTDFEKTLLNKDFMAIKGKHSSPDNTEENEQREEFLTKLGEHHTQLDFLKTQYRDILQGKTELTPDKPGHSHWLKKLGASLAILAGILAGAVAGAALGSLAGPGGTILGGIKGAIKGGGLATALTLGAGAVGGTAGGYLTYHYGYGIRNTLFPPNIKGMPISTEATQEMRAIDTSIDSLIKPLLRLPKPSGK